VCQSNPDDVLELAADGRLIALTPTGSETGARNSRLVRRLLPWADQQGGWKVFDSSTGFRLVDVSVLSPDACPDLVVELAGPSDDDPRGLTALRQKSQMTDAHLPSPPSPN
jgi:Uma2 family endonuclease